MKRKYHLMICLMKTAHCVAPGAREKTKLTGGKPTTGDDDDDTRRRKTQTDKPGQTRRQTEMTQRATTRARAAHVRAQQTTIKNTERREPQARPKAQASGSPK